MEHPKGKDGNHAPKKMARTTGRISIVVLVRDIALAICFIAKKINDCLVLKIVERHLNKPKQE